MILTVHNETFLIFFAGLSRSKKLHRNVVIDLHTTCSLGSAPSCDVTQGSKAIGTTEWIGRMRVSQAFQQLGILEACQNIKEGVVTMKL